MAWHSTQRREELITVLAGRLWLETRGARSRARRRRVGKGQCAFIRAHTMHRLINATRATARYVYVTGSAGPAEGAR